MEPIDLRQVFAGRGGLYNGHRAVGREIGRSAEYGRFVGDAPWRHEMKHTITDKAEVSIDFPDKFYIGSFGRESSLDVSADDQGIHIHLERNGGMKRRVGFHIHYYLLADLLASIGEALSSYDDIDELHRADLEDAAKTLAKAVKSRRRKPRRNPSSAD